MNATMVMSRMVWKEFHALKMVWILCVLGVLVLNGFLTVSAAAYHQTGYSGVFWALALVVPAAFVVASTAVTFAGEREERTADWLVALAPPFASLYLTKQLFILVSGLAMQVFLAVAAACFTLTDQSARYSPIQAGDVWETLRVSEFVFLECLVWGTFWSLQTARPVQAIFKTIATLIAIFVVSGVSLDWAHMHGGSSTRGIWYGAVDTWGWLRTTWTVAVIAASWVLGQRWLDGRAFEWEAVFARLFRRRIAVARKAVRERAEPWQRTWQRLWWLEQQSLKSFGVMTAVATVLSCLSILFGERPTLAWMMSFTFLLILIAGLQSWRGEQSRHQYRLLVNYGVSPLALWSNKLLMWLVAAVIAVTVVALPTVVFWEVLSAIYPKPNSALGYGPKWPSLFPLDHHFGYDALVMRETYLVIGLYGLMTFAAGFLWSLLSRKAVIAFGLTLVTLLVLVPWYGVVGALGMPMLVFLAPIPVWLLWVSLRHLKAWWVERGGWRVWLLRTAELTVVPLLLAGGAMAYRVYEIPWLSDEQVFGRISAVPVGDPATRVSSWNRVMEAVLALPEFAPDSEEMGMGAGGMAAAALVAAGEATEPSVPIPSATDPANTSPPSPLDEWIAANEKPLEELRDAVLATHGLMDPSASIWQRVSSGAQARCDFAVRALARQATRTVPPTTTRVSRVPLPAKEGEARQFEVRTETISESPSWLQSAVWLGGAIRRYAPLFQQRSLAQGDAVLFEEMLAWAGHPQQTEDTLRAGLSACSEGLRLWQVSTEDIRADYAFEHRNFGLPEYSSYWPWERARAERLSRVMAANRVTYLSQIQSGLRSASGYPEARWRSERTVAWKVAPRDFLARSGFGYQDNYRPVLGLDSQTTVQLHDAETRYRGTVAILAVVGYRRLHGRLPTSLTEVAPLFGENVSQRILKDPWSRDWLRYEPDGFPIPEGSPESLLSRPLIWSRGPFHLEVRPTDSGLQAYSGLWEDVSYGQLTEQNMHGLYVFPIPSETE